MSTVVQISSRVNCNKLSYLIHTVLQYYCSILRHTQKYFQNDGRLISVPSNMMQCFAV